MRSAAPGPLCLVFVLALSAACTQPGGLRPLDPAVPPTRVDAVIEVSSEHPDDPLTVDFGEVPAGEHREQPITIKNIGTDVLQLQDFALSNIASFSLVNLDELVPLLVPEASWELWVAYEPSQDESVLATLLIASNDRETPEVAVALRAEGLAPAIDIDPDSFDFGNREFGCVGSLDIQIANVGRADLVIDDMLFDDLSGNGELALGAGVSLPLILGPAEATQLEVFYTRPTCSRTRAP